MRKCRILFLLLIVQLIPIGLRAQQTTPETAPPGAQALNQELIVAARKSNLEAVKALLAKGADVNAKTEYGATPLFYACDRGNAEIVKLLLEHGADASIMDTFYKSTPIVWAAMRDHAAVVKLLLEKVPQSRQMVMGTAVNQGRVAIVKMLLETGTFNEESMTTYLTNAEKGKQTEIADLLKKAGAKPRPKVEYQVDPETLKLYDGTYKNDRIELAVKVKDGKLITIQSGFEAAWIPVSNHTFEPEGASPGSLVFNLEAEKIVSLSIKGSGGETTLKKMEVK